MYPINVKPKTITLPGEKLYDFGLAMIFRYDIKIRSTKEVMDLDWTWSK